MSPYPPRQQPSQSQRCSSIDSSWCISYLDSGTEAPLGQPPGRGSDRVFLSLNLCSCFSLCPSAPLDLCRLTFDGLTAPGMGLGQSGQDFYWETSPLLSLCTFRGFYHPAASLVLSNLYGGLWRWLVDSAQHIGHCNSILLYFKWLKVQDIKSSKYSRRELDVQDGKSETEKQEPIEYKTLLTYWKREKSSKGVWKIAWEMQERVAVSFYHNIP